jgi:hypothetical protein
MVTCMCLEKLGSDFTSTPLKKSLMASSAASIELGLQYLLFTLTLQVDGSYWLSKIADIYFSSEVSTFKT